MERMILIASVYAKPFTEPVPMIQHDRCDQGGDISNQNCRQSF